MKKDFIKKVRERAVGHEVIDTLNPAQQIIKIVDEELTAVLGSDTAEIIKSPKIPTIIMMVGLQGAGKTTFAGKLANKLKKEENARPLMIAADIYRPAAIDQLKTLGQQIDVPVFALGTEVPAVEIVRQGLEQAQANHNDYVLIDTAGRLQIDELLMNELRDVKALAQPNEILLVIDAMIGLRKLLRNTMSKKPLKWLRRCVKTPLILMISSINWIRCKTWGQWKICSR